MYVRRTGGTAPGIVGSSVDRARLKSGKDAFGPDRIRAREKGPASPRTRQQRLSRAGGCHDHIASFIGAVVIWRSRTSARKVPVRSAGAVFFIYWMFFQQLLDATVRATGTEGRAHPASADAGRAEHRHHSKSPQADGRPPMRSSDGNDAPWQREARNPDREACVALSVHGIPSAASR